MDALARRLIAKARAARKNAYAPYSGFKVGAALLSSDGRVFLGSNVENASYGATSCAERSALAAAVSAGARRFRAIAIVADMAEPCPPCGICRQALHEFSPGLELIMANLRGRVSIASLSDLLPQAFRRKAPKGRRHT
jgi:cytidine deaminase